MDAQFINDMYAWHKTFSQEEVKAKESLFLDDTTELRTGVNGNATLTMAKSKQRIDKASEGNRARRVDNLIRSVFNEEGGYSTDKKDKGNYHNREYSGRFIGTNHGVSAPELETYLGREATVDDMKAITKETAKQIYRTNYYDKFGIENLPNDLQEIVMHSVVNSGGHGMKVVQGLLGLDVDGVAGPNTRAAMKKASFGKQEFADKLLQKYSTFDTWETHGKGWTNRFQRLAQD